VQNSNKCIAFVTRSGAINWTWKDSFPMLEADFRRQISRTALFSIPASNRNIEAEDIQKMAEKAIAADNDRWVDVKVPDDEAQ
jgi:hypothetical protein